MVARVQGEHAQRHGLAFSTDVVKGPGVQRAHEVAARFGVFAGGCSHQPRAIRCALASGHRAVDEFHLLFAQGASAVRPLPSLRRAARGSRHAGVEVVFRRGRSSPRCASKRWTGAQTSGKIAEGLEPLRRRGSRGWCASGRRPATPSGPSSGVPVVGGAQRKSTITSACAGRRSPRAG